jgi:putative DNA primase/helicase
MQKRAMEFDLNSNFYIYQFRDKTNSDKRTVLTDPRYREFLLEKIIEHNYDVVFIDNVVSLFPGVEMNSEKEWSPINQWLLELRKHDICVVLIHHLGKDKKKGARGTTLLIDNANDVLRLTRPKGHKIEDGLKFKLKFEHFRTCVKDKDLITSRTIEYDDGLWKFVYDDNRSIEDKKEELQFKALKILKDDINMKKIDLN